MLGKNRRKFCDWHWCNRGKIKNPVSAGGGDAEVWDLPKMGITSNSHFMFQEMNNKQIADLIENWLKERKL